MIEQEKCTLDFISQIVLESNNIHYKTTEYMRKLFKINTEWKYIEEDVDANESVHSTHNGRSG